METKRKSNLIDRFVEMLPETHIRGYCYCGPNTNLESRLAQGQRGINELDSACRLHDIAYTESEDITFRHEADKLLVLKAIKRIYSKDSEFGERIAATIVSSLMSIKIFFTKVQFCFNSIQRRCLSTKSKKK